MIRKFTKTIKQVFESAIERQLDQETKDLEEQQLVAQSTIKESLEEELNKEGQSTPFLQSLSATKQDFDKALGRLGPLKAVPSVVSVKRKRRAEELEASGVEEGGGKR